MFGRYVNSIASGFEDAGYITSRFEYQEPASGINNRLKYYVLPHYCGLNGLLEKYLETLVEDIISACRDAMYLVVIKGDMIPILFLKQIKEKISIPLVTWFMDAIANVREGLERAKLSDVFMYFEGTDSEIVRFLDVPSHHLDLAYDERWYYPKQGLKIKYDISFVGTLYPNRLQFLEDISCNFTTSELSMRYCGSFMSYYRPWRLLEIRRQHPHSFPWLKNRRSMSHEQINQLNNSSAIALNILHPQSKDSLNMRTFETCGSACFQLTTRNVAAMRCFNPGLEIETYESVDEAVDKLSYFLKNVGKREEIARHGHEKVLRCHTMRTRVSQMIDIIKRDL